MVMTSDTPEITASSSRNFGLTMMGALLVVGGIPWLMNKPVHLWPFVLAGVFLVVSIAAPTILNPLNYGWRQLGVLLSRITGPIVLSLLFFLVVTPIALAMRLFGKDPLRQKMDHATKSYWLKRSGSLGSMRNQF